MKRLGIAILVASLVSVFLGAQPVLAHEEPSFTAGGIITEGHGKDAPKITFSVRGYVDGDGQLAGHVTMTFHNVYSDDLDRGSYKSQDINYVNVDPREGFAFLQIGSVGEMNGEEGWIVSANLADSGEPGSVGLSSTGLIDSIRITVREPGGTVVYDTAAQDQGPNFPREHAWRTNLDGGNAKVHQTGRQPQE